MPPAPNSSDTPAHPPGAGVLDLPQRHPPPAMRVGAIGACTPRGPADRPVRVTLPCMELGLSSGTPVGNLDSVVGEQEKTMGSASEAPRRHIIRL